MTQRRGLDYSIETRANLAGLDDFKRKIEQVRKTWEAFKDSAGTIKTGATKKNLDDIGRALPKLKAAAKFLQSIALNLARINGISAVTEKRFANISRKAKTMSADVQKFRTNINAATAATKKAAESTDRWANSLKRGAVIAARISIIFGAFFLITKTVQGVSTAITEAFKFNDSVEKARLSIKSLLTTMLDVRDAQGGLLTGQEAFAASTAEANKQMALLRAEGLKTSATFEQLLETFQTALGPGSAAGLNIDEIRKLTVLTSQAAQTIGVPQDQLAEEIRSLLTGAGNIRTSRISKQVLQISQEDVNNAKQLGNFAGFLTDKLAGFAAGAEDSLNTVSAKLINLGDLAKNAFGTALLGSFEKFKDLLDSVAGVIGSLDGEGTLILGPGAADLFQVVNEALSGILDSVTSIAQGADLTGLASLLEDMLTFGGLLKDVLGFVGSILGVTLSLLRGMLKVFAAIVRPLRSWAKDSEIIELASKAISFYLGLALARMVLLKGAALAGEAAFQGMVVTAKVLSIALAANKATLVQTVAILKSASTVAAAFAETLLLGLAVISVAFIAFNDKVRDAFLVLGGRITRILVAAIIDFTISGLEAFASFILKAKVKAKELGNTIAQALGLADTEESLKKTLDAQKELLAEAKRQGDVRFANDVAAQIEETRQRMVDFADATAVSSSAMQDAEDSAKAFGDTLRDKLLAPIGGPVTFADFKGLGDSFSNFKETIISEAKSMMGIVTDVLGGSNDTTDGNFFTSKLPEFQTAFEELLKQGKKADKAFALANAVLGLGTVAAKIETIRQKTNQSVEATRNLGESLRVGLLTQIDKITSVPEALRTDEANTQLVKLQTELENVTEKLRALDGLSNSVIATKVAALAAVEAATRGAALRTARAEVDAIKRTEAIRKQEREKNITAEEAGALRAIVSIQKVFKLSSDRLAKDREALAAQLATTEDMDTQLAVMAAMAAISLQQDTLEAKKTLQLASQLDILKQQELLRQNPAQAGENQFLQDLSTPAQAIAEGTQKLLESFRQGLIDTLGDALVDALFSQENTLRDKWEALMKDLTSILIKSFLEAKINSVILGLFGSGSGSGLGSVDGLPIQGPIIKAKGGAIPSGRFSASAAHFKSGVQSFAGGGRPAGIPASDTVPAWLTPGEWVHKLSAVRKYGTGVMAAINEGRINPLALQTLAASAGRASIASGSGTGSVRGYAAGGSVAAGAGSGGIQILNLASERDVALAMSGSIGKQVIVNTVFSQGQ